MFWLTLTNVSAYIFILSEWNSCVKHALSMKPKPDTSKQEVSTRRRRQSATLRQPTVADIAVAAGVSTATVSRALNMPGSVSAVLREKVQRAVDALGYVPSGAARALASNRSFTIGAVVPTVNNAIFATSIAAFENRLSQEGYTLLLTVSNYDHGHETEQVRRLLERGVDGLMLVGLDHAPETLDLIKRSGRAFVTIWGHGNKDCGIPCIGFDNAAAAEAVVDHLVDLGHSRISMIAGISRANDRAMARRAGFERAMLRHGLSRRTDCISEHAYSHEAGRTGLAAFLDGPEPPTAVVCGNDVLAMGAMFEAAARGLSIPEDLSITGYDNLPVTRHLNPPLTTVDIPSTAMADAAARALVEHLTTGVVIPSQELPAPLLCRGSTGPISLQAQAIAGRG